MDSLGNLIFVIFLIIFAIGSWNAAKAQKKALEKGNSPQRDEEDEPAQTVMPRPDVQPVPPVVPQASRKRKANKKSVEIPATPVSQYMPKQQLSQSKDKTKEKMLISPSEEEKGNAPAFDIDELKKAVIYSEILNRKYT